MSYTLEGALYNVGERVRYHDAAYVVTARRSTVVGIVYQLRAEAAEARSHYNVPQSAIDSGLVHQASK
ncbi:MAG: hypothetical protein IPP83_09240 [Flavobacteriales bacterium]|nr:hypothetical protein [Flavobacteriales bacterium]